MKEFSPNILECTIDKFILSFPNWITFETFDEPNDYYGIIFTVDNTRYQVINSKLGVRLLINDGEYAFRDLPFNSETAFFLPAIIKVSETNTVIPADGYIGPKSSEEFIRVAEKIIKELKDPSKLQ